MVAQNAKRDSENQPRVPAKQHVQGFCILRLDSCHELFICGSSNLNRLHRGGRTLPAPAKDDRKRQGAAIRGRAHSQTWRTVVPTETPANWRRVLDPWRPKLSAPTQLSGSMAPAYIRRTRVFQSKCFFIDEKNIFEKMVQIPAAPRIKRDHILIRDLVSWPDRRVLVFNLVCE